MGLYRFASTLINLIPTLFKMYCTYEMTKVFDLFLTNYKNGHPYTKHPIYRLDVIKYDSRKHDSKKLNRQPLLIVVVHTNLIGSARTIDYLTHYLNINENVQIMQTRSRKLFKQIYRFLNINIIMKK